MGGISELAQTTDRGAFYSGVGPLELSRVWSQASRHAEELAVILRLKVSILMCLFMIGTRALRIHSQ